MIIKEAANVWRWCGQVTAWFVILAFGAAICAGVLLPRAAGAMPYTILTGSMQPTLPPGTLVVVRPAAPVDIAVGDVITFQLRSGKPTVATHRVVGLSQSPDGTRLFRTRGDANDHADAQPVRPAQVKGKVWYDVPYLGYTNKYVSGTERHLVLVVTVSGLLVYSAYMLTGAVIGRRRAAVLSEERVQS